jgi:excinuclease ABC subunit C
MESVFLQEKPDINLKLRDVPHKPGVYLMKDRLKRVIYVGKARDLRKRLSQYFMPSRKMTADLKTRALLDSVWDFEIHERTGSTLARGQIDQRVSAQVQH